MKFRSRNALVTRQIFSENSRNRPKTNKKAVSNRFFEMKNNSTCSDGLLGKRRSKRTCKREESKCSVIASCSTGRRSPFQRVQIFSQKVKGGNVENQQFLMGLQLVSVFGSKVFSKPKNVNSELIFELRASALVFWSVFSPIRADLDDFPGVRQSQIPERSKLF